MILSSAVVKDRELLVRIAVHSPHLAGTLLKLLNDLEDAHQLGELPPAPLLREMGGYVQDLGALIRSLAATEANPFVIDVRP